MNIAPLRVLIVEDSVFDTDLMVLELRRAGYEVIFERVETPENMLRALEQLSWDVVLADYSMPHFSGLEALKLLKDRGSDIPFILVSGTIGEELAVEAMKAGAHDYVMKDNLTRLVPAVERELREAEMRKSQREAQEALRESERRHRTLVESINDTIFVLDKEDRVSECYGSKDPPLYLAPERYLGKDYKGLIPSNMVQTHIELSYNARKTGKSQAYEYFIEVDRQEHWFSVKLDLHEDGESIVAVVREISELKAAEASIREERDTAQMYLDVARVMILVLGTNQEVVLINRRGCEILGCREDEILGRNWFDTFIPERMRGELKLLFNRLVNEGDDPDDYVEGLVLTKSGEERVIAWYTSVITGEDGSILATISSGEDITERRRAEEALAESEARYRGVVDTSPNAIVVVDLNGRITMANQQAVTLYGENSVEAMIGKNAFEMIAAEDQQRAMEHLQTILEVGVRTVEYTLVRKNGATFPAEISVTFISDSENQPQGFVSVIRDITERKKAELEQQLNEARLKALVKLGQMTKASMDQLCDFALEQAIRLTQSKLGYLAFMNEDETVLTMHSWSKGAMEECAIKSRPRVYPLETTGLWGEAVRQRQPIITNDYSAPSPWKKGYPQGHVAIVRHMNIPVFDGERIVAVAGVGNKADDYDESDVHQLTLLMQGMWMLLQQRRTAEETKNAAETATLYLDLMGHDIRNQLQAIIMGTEILKHYELGVEVEPVYNLIMDSVQNSEALIRKVNATRGLLSAPLVNVSLRDVVEDSLKILKNTYDDIEIEVEYRVRSPIVGADEYIGHLLMNLLENAVLYNNKKIRCIWVTLSEADAGCEVSIADNGSGITDEKKQSLFDPNRRFGGVGIHQAMKIAQKYGGKISVHNRVSDDPSQGAEFHIWFPLSASSG